MTVNKTKDGNKLTIKIEGKVDTVTAPQLEKELKASLDGVEELHLDLSEMEYISSAGLRVLMTAHKTMSKRGSMKITGVNEVIEEIFDITGLLDVFEIE